MSKKAYPLDIENVGSDTYTVMSRGHHDIHEFMRAVRVVEKTGVEKLLLAFNEYGPAHENSSIQEQAELISGNADKVPDGYALAWIQTSVCGDGWFGMWDEETEVRICELTGAFDVIEQVCAA